MATSIKNVSSKLKIKPEKLKRTLTGLIFLPKDKAGVHLAVHAWVVAGKPDNAIIFDNADTLKACGIPICDGAFTQGLYRRIPRVKPREATIQLIPNLIKELRLAETKTTADGIQVAEAKEHHKMSY